MVFEPFVDIGAEARRGAVASGLMSALMTSVLFWPRETIEVWGGDGIVVDALPQSWIIAFMTFVMTNISFQKSRGAKRERIRPVLQGGIFAALIGCLGFLLNWLILAVLFSMEWNIVGLIAYKTVYGAVLALIITPPAFRLHERLRAH